MSRKTSLTLKRIWPFVAFIIVILIIWNTNILFQKLKKEERLKMELWAMAQKDFIENTTPNSITFEILQQIGTNQMIQVNANDKIIDFKNFDGILESDSTNLYNSLNRIKKENKPIIIEYRDSISGKLLVNQKLYYGDSALVTKLQYYPLALFLIIMLFGLLLYFIFKTNKISEQNSLWAAMAKETAHQIGTPLSSLIGWTTLMKQGHKPEVSILEMEKDIDRLKIITERFSNIGSDPVLEFQDVNLIISQTVFYIQKRSSDLTNIKISLTEESTIAPVNSQLLSWTIENIIKNGIDAIKGEGEILVSSHLNDDKLIILVKDSGEGIKAENFNQIFSPGFTTKKRGWGLGLSLAKRIIIDYHRGKIFIKKSAPKKGTTISIELLRAD